MKLNKDSCYTVSSATFVVAASDSLHKERADYVCDGVDDQVEIQAAIDALPSGGGKVVLLEGSFNFLSQVSRVIDNVVIEGMGKSTYLSLDNSTPVISAGSQSNWAFKDFATDNGWIDISSAQKTRIMGVFRENELPIDKAVIEPYYLIAKDSITQYYFVKNGLTGEIEKVVTDNEHAEIAIQYAIDNAQSGAAIFIKSIGKDDYYWVSDTITINKAIAIESFKRHGTRIKAVAGVDCGAIFTVDYTAVDDTRCSQISALSIFGNDQTVHGIHIINVPSGTGFRSYDIYEEGINGYGMLYESSAGDLEMQGGWIRGQLGAVKCSRTAVISQVKLQNSGTTANGIIVEADDATIMQCDVRHIHGADNVIGLKIVQVLKIVGCSIVIGGSFAGTKAFDAGYLYSLGNTISSDWGEGRDSGLTLREIKILMGSLYIGGGDIKGINNIKDWTGNANIYFGAADNSKSFKLFRTSDSALQFELHPTNGFTTFPKMGTDFNLNGHKITGGWGESAVDLSGISGNFTGQIRINDSTAGSTGPYWWNGSAWCKMDDWTQTIGP